MTQQSKDKAGDIAKIITAVATLITALSALVNAIK